MTLEEHRAEQRRIVQHLADEKGITMTPERWSAMGPMIEENAYYMHQIETKFIDSMRAVNR